MLTDWLNADEDIASLVPGSVWIPLSELPGRMHELPDRNVEIKVVGGGQAAVDFLTARGRRAQIHFASPRPLGAYRLWAPNEWLEQVAPGLAGGYALDLGCGSGRDAVYLASRGWKVTAIDRLPDAIELAKDLQARYSPESDIEWIVGDAKDPPMREFDLVCSSFLADQEGLRAARLSSGGSMVVESFTEAHRAKFGRPSQSQIWTVDELEVLMLSKNLVLKSLTEGWHGHRHTCRAWAMRVSGSNSAGRTG